MREWEGQEEQSTHTRTETGGFPIKLTAKLAWLQPVHLATGRGRNRSSTPTPIARRTGARRIPVAVTAPRRAKRDPSLTLRFLIVSNSNRNSIAVISIFHRFKSNLSSPHKVCVPSPS